MARRFEMLCRMLVLRAVAATDVTAGQTHPQAHPGIPYFYAIFADGHIFRMYLADLVFVCAGFLWHSINCSIWG